MVATPILHGSHASVISAFRLILSCFVQFANHSKCPLDVLSDHRCFYMYIDMFDDFSACLCHSLFPSFGSFMRVDAGGPSGYTMPPCA